MSILLRNAVLIAAALTLSGCAYDYLQRTDRVGYSAGNAVKANLEQQTSNPTDEARYKKGGLGKNGEVVPGLLPDETDG